MDRNREARRAAMVTTANGLSRRRHRTSSLRDSPEDDGPVELQETAARLRDRATKKERDRDRERERDRDRDRSGRSKRRRGEKYMHGSTREDGGDDSSEESVNDEGEDDPDDGPPVRYIPPTHPVPISSSSAASSTLTSQRKSYPPPGKVFRAAVPQTPTTTTWKAADEMIGVPVPRKARSASTKRSHDCWSSGGGGAGEHLRQASSSPVRPNMVSAPPVTSPSPAPISPSSSNASMKKKIKPNGPKQRPPKSSAKSSSSIQDDIEIEVAEVLYGLMRQSQGPSKQEMPNDSAKFDSREMNNRSSSDSKSRVSSPISNSPSVPPPQPSSSVPLLNSSSSAPAPLSAVAPKRKRPRPLSYAEEIPPAFVARSNPVSLIPKVETADQAPNTEGPSPNLEKIPGSAVENGGVLCDLISHATQSAPLKPEVNSIQMDAKTLVGESESRDAMTVKQEEAPHLLKESLDDRVDCSIIKSCTAAASVEKESRREQKVEIDLMAPPPQLRLSPEREGESEYGVEASQKPTVADVQAETKPKLKPPPPTEDEKSVKVVGEAGDGVSLNAEAAEEKKAANNKTEEVEPQKFNLNTDGNNDPQLDLENIDGGVTSSSIADDNKLIPRLLKHQQQQLLPPPPKSTRDDTNSDKNAQSSSLQLQMPVAPGWPGGLPPMGYVAPLQGVVSMDGSTMAPPAIQPSHFLFSQPRPKRCETHCFVARNILCHQQFLKMNSFWPAAAGSAPLFGAKPYNLNVVPPADLHGNVAGRSINPAQDKGQALTFLPGQPTSKEKASQAPNIADGAQKKQFFLQQSLPPGAPSNILHGPAFIFPLGQQQAAVAGASARPSSVKSAATSGTAASTSPPSVASISASGTAAAVTPPMNFNFPNVPTNETQYLAILGNSPYPFPIPAHVGAAPPYRGSHAQAMPFFNGSFYSSQMLHPSQLQQQQAAPSQQLQLQQGHQNNSLSTASSSSQKHSQNPHQKPPGNGANAGSTNPSLRPFPAPKNRASQPPQHEMGSEDSPSTADSRVSRPNMSVYGQNFALPIHPPNFTLLTPSTVTLGGTTSSSGNASGTHGEKKQQQPPQQQALKSGLESLTPPAFAVSFTSINGTTPGLDISTMAQNHAFLQSLPEAARNNYHIRTAAAVGQAAQQKKNYRPAEDLRTGPGDTSNVDEERKTMAARASASVGQSIAFSRTDLAEPSVSTMTGNNVVDSSARSINLVSNSVRPSRSSVSNAMSSSSGSNSQQQQQMLQLQKQQHYAAHVAATARSKTPGTSNGNVYADHMSSSPTVAAKFPTALSGFPPSLVQSSNSPTPSPQWKNSSRPATSQVSSPSMATSTLSAMKNLPQQQGRAPQSHTQISFGPNPKSTTISQAQPAPNSHQAPSPPMVVGSPSSSSISKGAGGSPRTTASTSTSNKAAQASTLSSQQGKNSTSVPNQKSSPAGGRNAPSILGSPHITVSSTGNKPQLQQPQLSKQSIQQAQLFFSNTYLQPQAPHMANTSSAATAASGYYLPRHRPEQQPQLQKSQGPASTSSSGMLSLSAVTLASAGTSDPAKAVAAAAAAASSMKGGIATQGILHVAQFSGQSSVNFPPPGFPPYVHAVPAAVQVKPAEQKQPAGNDNLNACWQPEMK
ncbi:hypothetical protein Ancab_030404 [Ancistrocladus abbreviatus]